MKKKFKSRLIIRLCLIIFIPKQIGQDSFCFIAITFSPKLIITLVPFGNAFLKDRKYLKNFMWNLLFIVNMISIALAMSLNILIVALSYQILLLKY